MTPTKPDIGAIRGRIAAAKATRAGNWCESSETIWQMENGQWVHNLRFNGVEDWCKAPLQQHEADLALLCDSHDAQAVRIETLFDAIKHGDAEHQRWLREAIDAHFAGEPVPPFTPQPEGKTV